MKIFFPRWPARGSRGRTGTAKISALQLDCTAHVCLPGAPLIRETLGTPIGAGLWEQAGMQAKVPTAVASGRGPQVLASQPGASADSVVLLNQLGAWGDDAAAAAAQVRGSVRACRRIAGAGLHLWPDEQGLNTCGCCCSQ